MKTLLPLLLALATFALRAQAAPLPIETALGLAQKDLRERGLAGEVSIVSLSLESGAVVGGKVSWFARWSRSIDLGGGRRESGLQIGMDGAVARMVKAPAKPKQHDHSRPSILDLKH